MRTREEQREERRRYEADVEYEVWRNGGNMDAVDRERVDDRYYDGVDMEACAREELRRQQPAPMEQEPMDPTAAEQEAGE